MIGGAIFVSVGQSIFSNLLLFSLPADIDPVEILQIGASELRQRLGEDDLPGVLDAYLAGLKGAFALGVALAVAAVVTSFGPPIKSLKNRTTKVTAVPA